MEPFARKSESLARYSVREKTLAVLAMAHLFHRLFELLIATRTKRRQAFKLFLKYGAQWHAAETRSRNRCCRDEATRILIIADLLTLLRAFCMYIHSNTIFDCNVRVYLLITHSTKELGFLDSWTPFHLL